MMKEKTRILIVDDDPVLSELLAMKLTKDGFEVIATGAGVEALRLAYQHHPDAIILDIMMPGMDGLEVCRRLREMTDAVIIFATAKNQTEDIIHGLQVGGDDYVIKPYDYKELAARLIASLRRRGLQAPPTLLRAAGELLWLADPTRRLVFIDEGETIQLTPREYELFEYLVRNQGRVMSVEAILSNVWGPEYTDERHLVKQFIYRLRTKLEPDPSNPKNILTVPGSGYVFEVNPAE